MRLRKMSSTSISVSKKEIHWSTRAASLGLLPKRVVLGASEETREGNVHQHGVGLYAD